MTTIRTSALLALLTLAASAVAQGPPVRHTVALDLPLQSAVELTGSVASRSHSLVASSVGGVVAALLAREGDRVEKGAPLVRLDTTRLELDIAAARGELAEAEARLALARTSLARSEDLRSEQVISEQQLDDALSERDAWTGRLVRLEAELGRLEYDLGRSTVRSPYGGVVVAEHAAVGAWIGAGDPVVEMIDDRDLEVGVEVPERYYGGLEVGSVAAVRFDALELEVEGRVRAIVPKADPTARTFPVKIAIDNPGGRIGVGMLGAVGLPYGEAHPVVVVPKDAVVDRLGATSVWVVDGEGGVRSVPVATGSGSGAWIEVSGDVAAGDRVITRGNERLQPGQTVSSEVLEYPRP